MADDKKIEGFKGRNTVIKKLKVNGDFGWMHLWIAENKSDGRKFMRLYRYMNWFGIPNAKYLASVQKMQNNGC